MFKKIIIVLILSLTPLFVSASFENNLYYGISGNQNVMALQEFLTEQSLYSGPITGNFYSLTLQGVKNFQIREKIAPVSGYFGPLSRSAANSILSVITDESGAAFNPATTTPSTNEILVATLNAQIKILMEQITELQKQTTALQDIQTAQQTQTETLGKIEQNTTPAPTPKPASVPATITPVKFQYVSCYRNVNGPYCTFSISTTASEITISADNGYFIASNCSNGEWANYDGTQRKGNPLACSKFNFQYLPSATGTIIISASAENGSATTSVYISNF